MSYLERLKHGDSEKRAPSLPSELPKAPPDSGKRPPLAPSKLPKAPFDGFDSTHGAHFQKNEATPWPADLTADLRRVAEAFEWSRQDVADFMRWARQSPRALADATAFLRGELDRLPPPVPEGADWCRTELAADASLRAVWRVDDCATDPVRVWLAIRGKGAVVVAIPRERFGARALARVIGDIAEQQANSC